MKSTVDPQDAETWNTLANDWDRPNSGVTALRLYTPLRLNFLIDNILRGHIRPSMPTTATLNKPLRGYRILEVGCGGGFVSEALAEKGASVVAIDCNSQAIKANQLRQLKEGSADSLKSCLYLKSTAEDLVRDKELADYAMQRSLLGRIWSCLSSLGQSEVAAAVIPRDGYDVVVASEVLEHVKSPRFFLKCLDDLVKPDGMLMITTPNRTWISRFTLITMAEKILRIVPLGVHSHKKFVRHDELAYILNATGCSRRPSSCCHTLLQWPRLWFRNWLRSYPLPPHSPLYPTIDDATQINTSYRHLGTQGVFFFPKVNIWTRVPTKCVSYMAAFKKLSATDAGVTKTYVTSRPIKDEL